LIFVPSNPENLVPIWAVADEPNAPTGLMPWDKFMEVIIEFGLAFPLIFLQMA
jgi:hypothetical protein